MAAARIDPYANFNFLVQIDGVTKAGFQEVSGLSIDVSVMEYRDGTDIPLSVRKFPGLVRYSPIVLKRGLTQDASLWNWFQTVLNGNVQRADGSIVLLDPARNSVLRWNFVRGWPSKWEGPHLDGKTNEVAIETLVIEHEGITLVVGQ